MVGVIILVCLLLLAGLFVALRYEHLARRDKKVGALQEPLQEALWRGVRDDVKRFRRWLWRA